MRQQQMLSATYNVFLGFRFISVGSEAYQAAASNLRFARKHVLKQAYFDGSKRDHYER